MAWRVQESGQKSKSQKFTIATLQGIANASHVTKTVPDIEYQGDRPSGSFVDTWLQLFT